MAPKLRANAQSEKQRKAPQAPATRKASLTEALQHIEDALIAEGYDNIIAPAQHGTFHWITRALASLATMHATRRARLVSDEHYQRVEDALLKAHYDDFMIATGRGSFHWMALERARAWQAETSETEHAHQN